MTVVLLMLLLPTSLYGQTNQFVIHSEASLVVHPNASVNIFSDVSNAGTFKSYTNSITNFNARVWQNESGSRMPDESADGLSSAGGTFRFSGLNQYPQRIISLNGSPNNGFPNIRIDNRYNVTAETSELYINNNLDFVNGNLILDNIDVRVGNAGRGVITGYSDRSFIVTGIGITGGSLIRSVSGTPDAVAFPVGSRLNSYTPASIAYTGNPQDLRVRVADNVFNKPAFPEYVYKTWVVATDVADPDASMDITLQHQTVDEGMDYAANRTEGYITRYNANVTGLWDVIPPSGTTTPGTITSRAPVFNAYMNTRLNVRQLASVEYFSKSAIKKEVNQHTPVLIPDAISPNGDGLNDTYVIAKRLPADKVRLEVYSRNQVLVFQDFDYKDTFDGTGNMGGFMNEKLPDGIYYYLISVNNAKGIPGYLVINR